MLITCFICNLPTVLKNEIQETVDSSNVEAMLSRPALVFNGDIRSHERVSLRFSMFIGYFKGALLSKCSDEASFLESKKHFLAESHDEQHDFPQQISLAQALTLMGTTRSTVNV